MGALAGWGMTGAAIYDAQFSGPEKISLTMTPVMIVYSSLFATNQMRRAIEHKLSLGQDAEVRDIGVKAGAGAAGIAGSPSAGPSLQAAIVGANLGPVSTFARRRGPFTVHFWAPMSKWMISGADVRARPPVEKISRALRLATKI
ncbi:hypothetical protein JL720_13033 [Aureococcus anophagefferens]|nr:hypothetical protein JL720_13033 [Aureococcus anophagefferens]